MTDLKILNDWVTQIALESCDVYTGCFLEYLKHWDRWENYVYDMKQICKTFNFWYLLWATWWALDPTSFGTLILYLIYCQLLTWAFSMESVKKIILFFPCVDYIWLKNFKTSFFLFYWSVVGITTKGVTFGFTVILLRLDDYLQLNTFSRQTAWWVIQPVKIIWRNICNWMFN
jgi:hypothetical protein